MPRRLVTISYTALDAGGGVPKFNRDLHAAFPDRERRHFCWDDCPWTASPELTNMTEWSRAQLLNGYLVKSRLVTADDVVVADGFWAKGLEHVPLAISHSHGIWSHLTHEDVLAGRQPDMPYHHAVQVRFRKRWRGQLRKPMSAVSQFIADQMRLQWGLDVDRVINNGVDTETYRPRDRRSVYLPAPLVIHGVNDRANGNKGWDHIEALKREIPDLNVMSLDEAYEMSQVFSDRVWTKPLLLALADVVVHPSGFEGNSMFVAEALSCGVPVACYEVGAMADPKSWLCGIVMPRGVRHPDSTVFAVRELLKDGSMLESAGRNARAYALANLSLDRFRSQWRDYIEGLERVHDA